MLNNSVLVEVLQAITTRLGRHVEKLKHSDKRENTIDVLTVMVANDTVKFFEAYKTLPAGEATEVLSDAVERLAKHAASWPNDGDVQALLDAESFLHSGIDTAHHA